MDRLEQAYFAMWQARCAMLRHATRESCILSCRIVGDILTSLGHRVAPVTVGATAVNRRGREAMENGEHIDEVEGALCLHCGYRGEDANKPGEWWGAHLALLVDNTYLFDPSADQFAVPEGGIKVGPLTGKVEDVEAFLTKGEDHREVFELPEGGLIMYDAHPEDLSYRDSMDWEETKPGDKLYDHVLSTVEGLLDLYGDQPLAKAPLPDLPDALSKRYSDRSVVEANELKSLMELGYTPIELQERGLRELRRELDRRYERGEGPHLSATHRRLLAAHGFEELADFARKAFGAPPP